LHRLLTKGEKDRKNPPNPLTKGEKDCQFGFIPLSKGELKGELGIETCVCTIDFGEFRMRGLIIAF